jgi:sortase A
MFRTTLYGAALVLPTALVGAILTFTSQPGRTPRPGAQDLLAQQVPAAASPLRRQVPVARPVPEGRALVTMRIPRFDAGWRWVVAEGVTPGVLDGGPGHFPGTALPGARGNTAYAAHRAGHGDPFLDFEQLRPGDRIILAQRGAAWTYQVTMRPRIIDVDDVWVLNDLPGRKLTLTTCWPRYGSSRRMYVRAELARVESRRGTHGATTWSAAHQG